MNFVHPVMLAAGAAVVLPLIIHWMTRPRPVRLSLSTIRFVLQAVQQKRARYRLRDFLVLFLRAVAIALLVYAFARPVTSEKPLVSPSESGEGVRVIIVDASASMGSVSRGVSLFEKARPLAAQYLPTGGGMKLNVILAGATPHALFDAPGSNSGALREELGKAQPRPQRLAAQAAVNLAAQMLAKSAPELKRELVIISDFQRSNWSAVDFEPLPKDTKIELKSVAEGDRPNLGLLRVAAQGRAEQGRELRVEIEVGNYSATARTVTVELSIGSITRQVTELCSPQMTTTLSASIAPSDAGWQIGQAKLIDVEDALRVDDERVFVLDVRPSPTYLLLTRESAAPRASSSHFVERALAPGGSGSTSAGSSETGAVTRPAAGAARVVRIAPAQFDREAAAADLIVIDHPGRLPPESVNLLLSVLRRGRPVLYIVSESVDATNLKLLTEAAGTEMRMPVEFLPPQAGERRRGLFLAEVTRDESPFSIFGESLPAVTAPLRFAGGLPSRGLDGGLKDDVLATYSDRSAAIVTTACGAGALGVINADLSDSNLSSSPAFVPLLQELVSRLMGNAASQSNVNSGEMLAVYLPPEAGAVEGLAIEPAEQTGSLIEERGMIAWRWTAAGEPGTYRVRRGEQTVFAVASAVPREESDMRSVDATVMQRLGGGRELRFSGAADEDLNQKDRAWAWALVACAVCMMLEVLVLKSFAT
ncbi:MAG: BatA and WFA domain-containing protein [Phycisphaeraceae bacterium]